MGDAQARMEAARARTIESRQGIKGKYAYTSCTCCTVEIADHLFLRDCDGPGDSPFQCAYYKCAGYPTPYCPAVMDCTECTHAGAGFPRHLLMEGGHCIEAKDPDTIYDCFCLKATRVPSLNDGPRVVPEQMDRAEPDAIVEQPGGGV